MCIRDRHTNYRLERCDSAHVRESCEYNDGWRRPECELSAGAASALREWKRGALQERCVESLEKHFSSGHSMVDAHERNMEVLVAFRCSGIRQLSRALQN